MKIKILHKETGFVIIEKPAGVLSIPDRFDENRPNVLSILGKQLNTKVFTVHRLDFNTSGLMIFALDRENHQYFNQLFQTNNIQKTYLTIVEGKPEVKHSIDLRIRENKAKKGLMETHISGKEAFTSFEKIEQFKGLALLKVNIKTGRTHQIRVHLSSIGYPVLADQQYGSKKLISLKHLKPKFNGEAKPLIKRMALEAHSISFIHPKTNEITQFENELSKDFSVCLKLLRKWGKLN